MKFSYLPFTALIVYTFTGCSVYKQINKQAKTILLKDTAIATGHIGISIYEPATNKYWYNHNETHYFIPASNTKLFTLYAGMKYLGDSLVGLRYQTQTMAGEKIIEITPTGDPTFLFPEFIKQPVFDFLKQQKKIVINKLPNVNPLGMGWAWDDYQETYMAPRTSFPMYGNIVKINGSIKTVYLFIQNILIKKVKRLMYLTVVLILLKNLVAII